MIIIRAEKGGNEEEREGERCGKEYGEAANERKLNECMFKRIKSSQ